MPVDVLYPVISFGIDVPVTQGSDHQLPLHKIGVFLGQIPPPFYKLGNFAWIAEIAIRIPYRHGGPAAGNVMVDSVEQMQRRDISFPDVHGRVVELYMIAQGRVQTA